MFTRGRAGRKGHRRWATPLMSWTPPRRCAHGHGGGWASRCAASPPSRAGRGGARRSGGRRRTPRAGWARGRSSRCGSAEHRRVAIGRAEPHHTLSPPAPAGRRHRVDGGRAPELLHRRDVAHQLLDSGGQVLGVRRQPRPRSSRAGRSPTRTARCGWSRCRRPPSSQNIWNSRRSAARRRPRRVTRRLTMSSPAAPAGHPPWPGRRPSSRPARPVESRRRGRRTGCRRRAGRCSHSKMRWRSSGASRTGLRAPPGHLGRHRGHGVDLAVRSAAALPPSPSTMSAALSRSSPQPLDRPGVKIGCRAAAAAVLGMVHVSIIWRTWPGSPR